jgi:hypothetical protein
MLVTIVKLPLEVCLNRARRPLSSNGPKLIGYHEAVRPTSNKTKRLWGQRATRSKGHKAKGL